MNITLPRWLLGSIFVTAFLGFLDAMYLTASHYIGIIPPCYIVGGCEQVTTSSYSLIFGIPVALMGTLYYIAVLATTLFYVDKKHPLAIKALQAMTVLGLLFSLWFTYVQGFIIEAWCSYCLLSAFTSTMLFVFVTVANRKMSKDKVVLEEQKV